MKVSIRRRLVWSYLLLTIITVIMFEIIILSALHFYYLGGVKQTLKDQGVMFISIYQEELSPESLLNNGQQLLESYDFSVPSQVQLTDNKGQVIADTHNPNQKISISHMEDVSIALKGEPGSWKGTINNESLFTVTQPIINQDSVIGIIRLTTSLEPLNGVLLINATILIMIGIFVIIIAAVISYFLANTITKPLNHITKAAQEMASGKFSIRISNNKEDELGKLSKTLNFMASEIERHEKLKNEFIASVSHELRTPLTSVKGWAITLHSMSDDDFYREGLEIISNESERLSILLGDLLDLSSLSSGKVNYKFEEIILNDILYEVIKQLSPRASRNKIELIERIDTEIIIIMGDYNRLKQVLINVIDNALKFTSEGGAITVNLKKSKNSVHLKIIDTGRGIPIEELKSVKEKFFKGKSKGSGTGLGLAICQEIVDAHRGTFDISSKEGKGTTVEIILPL